MRPFLFALSILLTCLVLVSPLPLSRAHHPDSVSSPAGCASSTHGLGNGNEIVYEVLFSLEDVTFGEVGEYDSVDLPGHAFTADAGDPVLPFQVLHFAIGPQRLAQRVEVIRDVAVEIPGEYDIVPARETGRWRAGHEPALHSRSDLNVAGSYPQERIEVAAQGSLGGVNIVTVHVYPLEYLPAEKRLVFHERVRFRIVLQEIPGHDGPANSYRTTETVRDMLSKLVANPECLDIPRNDLLNTDTIDYLIITSESIRNAGLLQPLVDSKIDRGLSVLVESVENIEATVPGRDTQERIRNFVKEKYTNNGLVWVLLVGDTNIIPERWADPGGEEAVVISDLYFSDLDGDWDADGDGVFGEPEDDVDLYPDVFVGRASVDSEIEAQTFVDKVLAYESGVPNYSDTALFLGSEDYFDAGGRANDYIEQEYFPEQFDPITTYYERDIPCYRDRTIDTINSGVHLINSIDHGRSRSLRVGCDWLEVSDMDGLSNALRPSILWACGCESARIDEDCIAEHWITNADGGGVAYIGFGGYSNVTVSDQMLNPEFYHSLFADGLTHIGQTLADSKVTFIGQAGTDPKMRHDLMALNLLGDPEMSIRLPSMAGQEESPRRLDAGAGPTLDGWLQSPVFSGQPRSIGAGGEQGNINPVEYKLVADDGAENDWFGRSVSISGNQTIVGARRDDDLGNESGSVYIFSRDAGGWTQKANLLAGDGMADDWFGYAVSISGDRAIVGAYYDDDKGSSSGSAYVFRRGGSGWTQQAKLTASDGEEYDYFGWSVSISGDDVIVGAKGDDDHGSYSGSAYIFRREGTEWTEVAKLAANDAGPYDQFGWSVSIDGQYAIVSTGSDEKAEGFSCPSYVFEWDGGQWVQQARLSVGSGEARSRFGCPVSISGDFAIVGGYDGYVGEVASGVAYVFGRDGSSWTQQARLEASDGETGDKFGYAVSLSGDHALVGARGDDDRGNIAGSAYVFGREGDNWVQRNKLTASDGASGDRYGYAVSLSGQHANVGSGWDDDNGDESGSAYVYSLLLMPAPHAFVPDAPDGHVGEWHSFTSEYQDVNGWRDIARTQMVLGRSTRDRNGLSIMVRTGSNTLYLRDRATPGWLGPCAPGEPVVLSNGMVELDCALSTIDNDGGHMLQVTAQARWIQQVGNPRNLTAFLRATDKSRQDSGFVPMGTWTLLPKLQ